MHRLQYRYSIMVRRCSYSFIYGSDINRDGFDQNDLFNIPKNDNDIEFGSIVFREYLKTFIIIKVNKLKVIISTKHYDKGGLIIDLYTSSY